MLVVRSSRSRFFGFGRANFATLFSYIDLRMPTDVPLHKMWLKSPVMICHCNFFIFTVSRNEHVICILFLTLMCMYTYVLVCPTVYLYRALSRDRTSKVTLISSWCSKNIRYRHAATLQGMQAYFYALASTRFICTLELRGFILHVPMYYSILHQKIPLHYVFAHQR